LGSVHKGNLLFAFEFKTWDSQTSHNFGEKPPTAEMAAVVADISAHL
jgi:hypothetical protein